MDNYKQLHYKMYEQAFPTDLT